jgi:hypothetical protein
MRKLVDTLEPWRKRAEWLLKKVLGGILKALGISLAKIEAFFNGIISALNPLKPIEKALAELKAKLQAQVAKVLEALGIDALLARLEAMANTLVSALDDFLHSACAKEMGLAAAPAGARATPSRRPRSARR